ncbi:lipoate--protein ligase family protein [Parachlamydia sp. AcF125]|uniref:lipoate--protein ligase family protein n=1 Tax=Parachlamydia sp. AcF125 TaxID=2795736 RepID=UPI001BC8D4BB|nr:lipoate--protein ligase family protein [Parachlamydia sp. AcF125]MBS4167535.1 Lipoate-protein ligase LplJ [Parachlamydia sp. AcF125]
MPDVSHSQKPLMHLAFLEGCSIFRQLQLEEALLRTDSRNWCLLNTSVEPAIVMGISGQVESLLNLGKLEKAPVPVIRRYSGGGTVYVDANTYFVSFIIQKSCLQAPAYPEFIHQWAKQFYIRVFYDSAFQLLENDYVFGMRKFGGNAQYIRRDRIAHHTSFLWDFDPIAMEYLLLPQKTPRYRNSRSHSDFLCSLRDRFSTKKKLEEELIKALYQAYQVVPMPLEHLLEMEKAPHRQATSYVNLPSFIQPAANLSSCAQLVIN